MEKGGNPRTPWASAMQTRASQIFKADRAQPQPCSKSLRCTVNEPPLYRIVSLKLLVFTCSKEFNHGLPSKSGSLVSAGGGWRRPGTFSLRGGSLKSRLISHFKCNFKRGIANYNYWHLQSFKWFKRCWVFTRFFSPFYYYAKSDPKTNDSTQTKKYKGEVIDQGCPTIWLYMLCRRYFIWIRNICLMYKNRVHVFRIDYWIH